MAESAPLAFVTSALSHEIGPSRVQDFLLDQFRILEAVSRRDESALGDSHSPRLVYGTAGELLAMALERGVTDPSSLVWTGLLCENVFVQGGLGWPTPIRRIGGLISARQAQGSIPWAIAALPIGRDLFFNEETLEGMTSSSRFNQIVLLPKPEAANLTVEAQRCSSAPTATSYLGGSLWGERQALLPKVALHEASHYANFLVLDSWIEENAAKPADKRDAAFQRHCFRTEDGSYRLDLRFATLFLELAACLATGTFFDTILKSGDSGVSFLQTLVRESLTRGVRYMTDPTYAPYLQQAGIPSPDRQDARSISETMRRFVALI